MKTPLRRLRMKTRKSWRDKLEDSKDLPKVVKIPERMKAKWGKGTLVIPAPKEVDEMMRRVPKRKVTTVNQIRAALAERHSTTMACPMTTGIFAWIAANAAEETIAARPKARVTPYWRTLKSGGVLNEKYPGGIERQRQHLEAEGHTVIRKGKDHVVTDHEKKLFDFNGK
jgi:hypothetical protein